MQITNVLEIKVSA